MDGCRHGFSCPFYCDGHCYYRDHRHDCCDLLYCCCDCRDCFTIIMIIAIAVLMFVTIAALVFLIAVTIIAVITVLTFVVLTAIILVAVILTLFLTITMFLVLLVARILTALIITIAIIITVTVISFIRVRLLTLFGTTGFLFMSRFLTVRLLCLTFKGFGFMSVCFLGSAFYDFL